ncbi:alpha/beta hydrolase [Altererythrobacter sp. MF3-039]|uniref:alpha/beta hydrolase n=1 Tax=Altererythrobacter sp. MF3-039 TaxID=3252901 RepID=UPI00390C8AEA
MNNHPKPIRTAYQAMGNSGAQLHYRIGGEGPPLIMLHPSPQDSQALIPAMQAFSQLCTCVAPDTPGYGLSDDTIGKNPTMEDYANEVFAFTDSLGIERFIVYGAATGAQIAIEMGKHQPERLALVMLDANGHIDAPERARIMEDYFPEVTPRRDGGHLMTYWDMCANLFLSFPWNSTDPADRLPLPRPPVEVIQQILLRYLDAGEQYDKAYRAAFEVETIEHFAGSTAPIVMNRWEGSPVLGIADDLIAKGLPENVHVLRAGPTLPERYAVQIGALNDLLARENLSAFEQSRPAAPHGPRRDYAGTASSSLHLRRNDTGSGSRLVFLHSAGTSSKRWQAILDILDGTVPYAALDLPGHGHSPALHLANADIFASMAEEIRTVLACFSGEKLHLVGEGLGAAIAAYLQSLDSSFEVSAVKPGSLGRAAPNLTLERSGAHLVNAWQFVRDRQLRSPWDDDSPAAQREVPGDLSPEALHAQTVELLRSAEVFPLAWQEEAAIDWDALATSETIRLLQASGNAELAAQLLG